MIEPTVLVERVDTTLLITFNRPDKLNAIDQRMSILIGAAIETLESDPTLRVGVLTGAGRGFCSGADFAARQRGERALVPGREEWGFAGLARHWTSKPLVAAVNGVAFGGGFEIVLGCDLVVAARGARFALPEVRRGLIATGGGLVNLPELVGRARAMQLALTGDPIDAETALHWGLADVVVDDAETLPMALRLAARVAEAAPLAVGATKRVLRRHPADAPAALEASWELCEREGRVRESADAAEGTAAFLERRDPHWRGR